MSDQHQHREKGKGREGPPAETTIGQVGKGEPQEISVEDIDFSQMTSVAPEVDSCVAVGPDGQVNIWLDLKKPLPPLPHEATEGSEKPLPPEKDTWKKEKLKGKEKDYDSGWEKQKAWEKGRRPTLLELAQFGSDSALKTDSSESDFIEFALDPLGGVNCPPLNIVVFVVGSRGDVQPYIALALRLIKSHGHRVRIATHTNFKDFVLSENKQLAGLTDAKGVVLEGRLEFFDIGGDPKELMAYMVKNPGLLPGLASLTNGDVSSKRKMTAQMIKEFYHSCFHPDQETGRVFGADAIISNPPAFAHVHVAEALGLPLLMSFLMPWSPTANFAHPLVNVQSSNAGPGMTNYLSYAMADTLMWQGLGDIINDFRTQTLKLEPLNMFTGPMVLERGKLPWMYAWSDALLPKPQDWKSRIDIVGFFSLGKTSNYQPAPEFAKFLATGPAPIYIGFGSIVLKDPQELTKTIFSAVGALGVRAVISAGWSGLGTAEGLVVPENIYILKEDCPHDWLFADGRIAAVCHHGGAGTTAAGLAAGLPTVIVPFFGDQKFWGQSVASAGAGPPPIPHKHLDEQSLFQALRFALSPEAKEAAQKIAAQIRSEDGTLNGVNSFHSHLPLANMRCDLDAEAVARWWHRKYAMRLSSAAAGVLVEAGKLKWKDLQPHRPKEYWTTRTYVDPFSSSSLAIVQGVAQTIMGTAQLFYKPKVGATNMTQGLSNAYVKVFGHMQEGFENLPGFMGSRTRPRTSRIENVGDGVVEGFKGLGLGFMDGVTGLVTDPMDGYHKHGYLGATGGVFSGVTNLLLKPLGGTFSFIVHPVVGAYRSVRAVQDNDTLPLRKPREAASSVAAAKLTKVEKQHMLSIFEQLTASSGLIKGRRTRHKRMGLEMQAAYISEKERQRLLDELDASWTAKLLPPHPEGRSGASSAASSRPTSRSSSPTRFSRSTSLSAPSQAPSQTLSQVPSHTPFHTPSHTPSQGPSHREPGAPPPLPERRLVPPPYTPRSRQNSTDVNNSTPPYDACEADRRLGM